MKRYLFSFFLFVIVFSIYQVSIAQKRSDVIVDDKGVMRWGKGGAEVYGFGVNYTVPFAHAYRAAKQLGVSPEKAIDADVYHFARLGFDAYRVHVWDTEISDSAGNLITNEHLRLFDYLLMRLKERGIKVLITPIAYWGNGYPEKDEPTPGFAAKYGKDNCLTDEGAIKAQENYLHQFLNHVNPYTKTVYKNDPDIVAFEISNEPHHRGSAKEVTTFIDRMVKAMRKTGCDKPIFYNVSHSVHLAEAYYQAGIQGGTFQWYPTGLGARRELGGNFLFNVDRYTIPFAANPGFRKGAKIVYEFDAADVGRSYIYPAMARSFRTAGIQWATHFAYDPTYMAYANTEYNTHYMNLVYAPQKALSLKIASEVFHNVPLYKDFGRYPANTSFGDFRVSYEEDLAEMVNDRKFIYTNNTDTKPAALEQLTEIAGFGSSPVVTYEGQGAYFLDRIESGVWRLEVMPDAIWTDNIFGRNSLKKEVAVVHWKSWPMTINLPDLGDFFTVRPLNANNTHAPAVVERLFAARPGTYLLTRKGVQTKLTGEEPWNTIKLNEFSAPPSTVKKTYVLHSSVEETRAGQPLTVSASVVSVGNPESVELYVFGGQRPQVVPMKNVQGYRYAATIPAEQIREGFLRYYIAVKDNTGYTTFPSGAAGTPAEWDFYHDDAYTVAVVSDVNSLYIFNATSDSDGLSRQWKRGSLLKPNGEPGKASLHVNIEKLFTSDEENPRAEKIHDYSMRYYFAKKIEGRKDELAEAKKIVFRGHALNGKPCQVQLALVTGKGEAFGGVITVGVDNADYALDIASLKAVKLVTLPRPYPGFLPYYFEGSNSGSFDLKQTEVLQISIGPGITEQELVDKHGIAIESVRLE